MVSTYMFRVALGQICTQYLAWSRTEDRPQLDPGSKLLLAQYTKIGVGRKQKERLDILVFSTKIYPEIRVRQNLAPNPSHS